MSDLSIIIPVYRSAGILPELVSRLDTILPSVAASYEVIMVCDGSPDDSWQAIKELAEKYPYIKGVNLTKNYGQHNAILIGLREARYSVIVTLDDDLQHPPEEIPKLLEKLGEGYDVVYGVPIVLRHHHFAKNLGSRFIRWVLGRLMGKRIATHATSFRVMKASLCKVFAHYRSDYVHIDSALCWATDSFGWVHIRHDPRKSGASNYSLVKLIKHSLHMLTGYSVLPLQIASFLGFFFMLFGVSLFLYVMWNYFTRDAVQGFTFLAATIALFSGVQLFCLGIIGAYLARIHLRSIGKPVALVREIVGNSHD